MRRGGRGWLNQAGPLVDGLPHVGVPGRLLCGVEEMNVDKFIKQCPLCPWANTWGRSWDQAEGEVELSGAHVQ